LSNTNLSKNSCFELHLIEVFPFLIVCDKIEGDHMIKNRDYEGFL